jgi:microcystin degradation protein MlrC
MKKIAILRFWYEGNSFSPAPAAFADFQRREWLAGAEAAAFYAGKGVETGAAVDFLHAHDDIEGHFLRCAAAYPAGEVEAGLFPGFIDEVIAGLRGQHWDGVYASLHGATVAADMLGCETQLLEKIRAAVGPIPIAASFDIHGNLDPRIGDLADIVVGYKTHPHVDMYDTGWKAMTLLRRAMAGEIQPTAIIRPVDFAPTSHNMRTAAGPMADMVGLAAKAEARLELFDVSVFGGFPYADSPHTGASISVCYNGERDDLAVVLEELDQAYRGRADRFDMVLPDPGAVIAAARQGQHGGRVAVVEPSDNVFSGGAGDTPGLLRAAIEQAPDTDAVFAFFWDPDLAKRAHEAGMGATLDCAFGGRLSDQFGAPVHTKGVVDTLTGGRFKNHGPMEKGLMVELGPTAVIRVGGIRIIVTSRCVPINDPAYFELHQIDLADYALVYAKAKNHFHAAFADQFDAIIDVETKGPAPSDISTLSFKHAAIDRLRFGRTWGDRR